MLTLFICSALGAQSLPTTAQPALPKPPATIRRPVTETLHGVKIVDPYRWLENQTSKETRAWIASQNAHTDRLIKKLPTRPGIEKRLLELQRIDRYSVPVSRGNRLFFTLRRPQDEQAILYVQEGAAAQPRVLIDPNTLDAKKTTSVEIMDVSRSGQLVAYALRRGGDDKVEIRLRDVDANRDLEDRLSTDFHEDFAFTHEADGYFYVTLKPLTGRRLRHHTIGSSSSQDMELFGKETSAEDGIGADVSENGRWLLIHVYHGWAKNDVFVKDLLQGSAIRPLIKGMDAVFDCQFAGDTLLARTDQQAPNRRIVEVPLEDANPAKWRTVVPEAKDAIESFSAAGGRVFVQYLHNVQSRIAVYDIEGTHRTDVKLPGAGTATVPTGEWEQSKTYFQYMSHITPRSTLTFDTQLNKVTPFAQPKAPLNPNRLTVRQVWVTSKDGTKLPMFLIHKKGLVLKGDTPTWLYAYGGFNASEVPFYDPEAILWAERGGVYAVANLRGGGEFGEAWHRAGMLEKKQNVFDDFFAAAQWLISNKVTNPSRLGISGVSNGGLLMGAAVTQRPELFKAVVCAYPLEDMLRYHKFLQGPQWVPEYGSAADQKAFKWLLAYSPYHRVVQGKAYPSILFVTGDADTRVAPLHARKMCALLQWANTSSNPIMLHYETTTGHSGGEPLSKRVKSQSLEFAYLMWQLGMK